MHKIKHRGFTYIEIIIVVGLTGIILAFGMAMNLGSIGRSGVNQERDLFVSLLLSGARAKAMANIDQKSHGIHIDNTCNRYILFESNPPIPSLPSDGNCTPKDSREISFTSSSTEIINTGGSDIVFEQLSGDVIIGAGVIVIKGNNATTTIELSSAGRINW